MKIAFTGKILSGKTTCANHFVKDGWTRMSLAAPLKKIVHELFDIPMNYLTDTVLKEKLYEPLNTTPRRIMQVVGTELFRDKLQECIPDMKLPNGNTVWINKFMADCHPGINIVCDDLRFQDEANALAQAGFFIVELRRGETIKKADDSKDDSKIHKSEAGCFSHVVVYNNGPLEETIAAIMEGFRSFEGRTSVPTSPPAPLPDESTKTVPDATADG